MAEFEKLVRDKQRLFDQTPENLATASVKAQRQIWNDISDLVQSLETDQDGRIAQTQTNVRKIGEIQTALVSAIAGSEYIDAVRTFLGDIDSGARLTDEIAKNIQRSFEPSEVVKQLLEISKQNALQSLLGESMRARVTLPFVEQLTAAVATRSTLSETVKALRTVIEGDKDVDGRLVANVKTVAQTAQAIADRNYSAQVNEAIGAEWYRYAGSEIDTTRDFCAERHGQYFHKKEIEGWADLNWDGKIAETNSRTIFSNAGGWNCRHSIIAVSIRRVPQDVIQRNIANGNYNPN
jgi:uncharacterized protein with GYD domain